MKIHKWMTNRVEEHASSWKKFVWTIASLVHDDRIGTTGSSQIDVVPGIWGKSYVRTYYSWMGQKPSDSTRMEGGIATTYYVFHSLARFHRIIGVPIGTPLLADMLNYFVSRSTSRGIGVYTIDHRGIKGVQAHLRHTCYGYLTALEACSDSSNKKLWEPILSKSEEVIIKQRHWKDLSEDWFTESWPVGGITSYIAARDALVSRRATNLLNQNVVDNWPGVRTRMIQALGLVTSGDIKRARLKVNPEYSIHDFIEHYPFFDPIGNRELLRLHSTLGVLHLVGEEIAKTNRGQERIEKIVRNLELKMNKGAVFQPKFSSDGPPSISAACCFLCLLTGPWLGDWYTPKPSTYRLLSGVCEFIEQRWHHAEGYSDFWSEFCAPILMEPWLVAGLKISTKSHNRSTCDGMQGITHKLFSGDDFDTDLESKYQEIKEQALDSS